MTLDPRRSGARYSPAFEQLGQVNAVFPESARQQMSQMVEQVARTDKNISQIFGTAHSVPIKGGFAAEELHAESFNLEAILQRKSVRALTDHYDEWHNAGFKVNDPTADIVVAKGRDIIHRAQVKYYENAEKTANALRELRGGTHHYHDADSFVAPSDQISPADGSRGIGEYARKTELKNVQTRPDVANAARHVGAHTSDRLSVDSVESQPVSKDQAHNLAKRNEQGDEFRKGYQDRCMTQSTVQQMKQAAVAGAATTAIVVGILNSVRYCSLAKEGKITAEEAALEIVKNTAVASVDSAVKAAAGTGAVSFAVRQGGQIFASQALTGLLARNAVVGGAVCGVDLIKCMVMVATGRMSMAELETRTGKNVFTTGAGVMGSAIGMNLLAGSSIAFAPLVGALAGGLIAGIAMQIAIENHIEKPYHEIIQNTELLTNAGMAMQDTAEAFVLGQRAFVAFLECEKELEAKFSQVSERIQTAGNDMTRAIDRL